MESLVVHHQAEVIASWLSSSVALRQHLRARLLPASPASPSIDFIEVVIAWDEDASC